MGSLLGLGALTGVVIHSNVALATADLGKAKLYVSTGTPGTPMVPVTDFDMVGNSRNAGQPHQHSTLIPTGLLSGVLSAGTQKQFDIVIDEYGWTSRPVSVVYTPGGLLGARPTCDNVVPRS